MNVVFIIPTGIGCEIGGHAGDATPSVKLIASVCDKIIVNPNAVNASDLNEMPDNALYVEGSILDRFLKGSTYLEEVRSNKILLVVNKPCNSDTINAVNAARAVAGIDIEILELRKELKMVGYYGEKGKACGDVEGWEELCEQIDPYRFDALAIQTRITVDREAKFKYLRGDNEVNPWGGVEAIASKLIADELDKPVAHAPFVDWQSGGDDLANFYELVDPRMSAEMVSICYLHCILKGLWKAPRINSYSGLSFEDVDFMISPFGCFGPPHEACHANDIPVIMVRENKTIFNKEVPDEFIVAESYLEAVGIICASKIGITLESVRRPLGQARIIS